MNQTSVNIFVLNWNGRDLTIDCLKSLEKVNYSAHKVYVIDNGSTDDSVTAIQKEFPQVEIIELSQNLGYAGGNNAGFKKIANADYTIFLNNDTTVDSEFIAPLIESLEQNEVIMQSAPKIYYTDNPNMIWFAGGSVNLITGLIYHRGIRKKDTGQFDQIAEIDYATGCCFCMRSKDFEELGMFDESFPMYGEDVDLSLRIRELGGRVVFVPESKVWHKVSASIGGPFSKEKWKRKLSGRMKLLVKHIKPYQIPFSLPLALAVFKLELLYLFLLKLVSPRK